MDDLDPIAIPTSSARRLGTSLPTAAPSTPTIGSADDPLTRLENRVAAGGARVSRGRPRIGGRRGFRFSDGPDRGKTLGQVIAEERGARPNRQQERSAAETAAFFDESRQRRQQEQQSAARAVAPVGSADAGGTMTAPSHAPARAAFARGTEAALSQMGMPTPAAPTPVAPAAPRKPPVTPIPSSTGALTRLRRQRALAREDLQP